MRIAAHLPQLGLITLLPLLLFWRWVFQGQALYWGTLLLQFYPWHQLVKTSIQRGHWPLWNPLLGNGTPLLANMQSAVFYPPNLLYLIMPVAHGLTLSVVTHLILAGGFMYLYAQRLGLTPFAATISALAYMFSGYIIGRTQFVPMVNAAAWYPLLLLLADNLATRRRLIDALGLATVLALQMLAGHAQLWFYGLLLIGAYTLFRSWQAANGQTTKGAGRTTNDEGQPTNIITRYAPRFPSLAPLLSPAFYLALAVGLSLLLTAAQLLPTAEFLSQSPRSDGAGAYFALSYSFWPWRLITLLAPNFFGHPAQGNYWGYANFWEDHAYAGVLPLILAGAAIWYYLKFKVQQRPLPASLQPAPFFAALIPISLILAMGWNTPIYLWVFNHVPGFGYFQAPARLLIWYTVAIAVLAGLGAHHFQATERNRPYIRRALAASIALTAAGFLAGFYLAGREVTFLTATQQAGILLILSLALLLIRPYPAWQWAVIIFVAADLLLAAWPLIPTQPAALFEQPIASAQFLKSQPGSFRYMAGEQFVNHTIFNQYFQFKAFGPARPDHWQRLKETLAPNFGVYASLPSANNDDPLVVGRWQQLVRLVDAREPPRRARLLALMNVGYWVDSAATVRWPEIYQHGKMSIQQLPDPLPRAYFVPTATPVSDTAAAIARLTAPDFDSRQEVIIMSGQGNLPAEAAQPITAAAPVEIQDLGPNRVELLVDAPGPGFVVLADTFYPGWQATINGQPAEIWQANLAFRAVAVKAGPQKIEFSYRPRSFTFGLWTSSIAWLIIAVMAGWLLRPKI